MGRQVHYGAVHRHLPSDADADQIEIRARHSRHRLHLAAQLRGGHSLGYLRQGITTSLLFDYFGFIQSKIFIST